MLSLSNPLRANVFLNFFFDHQNIYGESEAFQKAQWRGKYAETQGLQGPIQKDDWLNACNGLDPDGNAIRRQQTGSRAGWDITLSASKSVSLKALIDQDPKILEAHRKAVDATVNYIEENCIHAQIKRNGKVNSEQTGKVQIGLFERNYSRNFDPQLHTHVVILNQTLCSDDKSRTLDSREIFNQVKTIGAIYDHTLAYHLQQQGYDLNWTSDHTFEIEGYAREKLEQFSTRRQEIFEYLEIQNINAEGATAVQKTAANLYSRVAKVKKLSRIDHERQHQRWIKTVEEIGIEHPQPNQDLEDLYQSPSHPGSVTEVINTALERTIAKQLSIRKYQLLRECLRYSQGFFDPRAISKALNENASLIQAVENSQATTKSLRQDNTLMKEVVELAVNQQVNSALELLDRHGAIAEIKDEADRLKAIAQTYLERPHERQVQTLILCDTNRDRQIITDLIRASYIEAGKLGQESIKIQTLQSKRLDEQAIAQAYNYEVGDVIRFRQSTPKLPSLYYRVSQVEGDRLQLKDRQGEVVELPIHQYKEREVFRCHEIELREGDRLRFTRNQRDWKQINGQMFTIEHLNENGTIQINSRGKEYPLALERLAHIDYAYCQTVADAEKWTAKEVLWLPNQLRQNLLEACAKARGSIEIIAHDKNKLK